MIIRLFFLFLSVFLFVGCNKGVDANLVEGIVTFDGKPLAGASITFFIEDDDSKTAGGFSGENGYYRITPMGGIGGEGAFEGNYVITVSKSEVVKLPQPIKYDDGTISTETTKQILPSDYQNRQKTPLKATVQKGRNKIDLAVNSK